MKTEIKETAQKAILAEIEVRLAELAEYTSERLGEDENFDSRRGIALRVKDTLPGLQKLLDAMIEL